MVGALEILGSVAAAISVVALALPFMARIRAIVVTSEKAREQIIDEDMREVLRRYQAHEAGVRAGVRPGPSPPPPGWEAEVIWIQRLLEDRLKKVESGVIRIETNITWLIRIVGVQFAFLSAVAFTA